MQVGWGQVASSWTAITPRPADPAGGREAVVGVLGPLVTAEGGQPGQPPAAIGATEAADRHREAVQDRDGRIEADLAQQLLAELGLDRPTGSLGWLRRPTWSARSRPARRGSELRPLPERGL
jgi:hypothetical protein